MEKWDAYDRFGDKLGFEITRGEPIPPNARHLVAHMIYVNREGKFLLQRRADDKELAPGLWALTGGSALSGEDSRAACIRETEEELGFTPDMRNAEVFLTYHTPEAIVDVYMIYADIDCSELKLQEAEVAEAKWLALDELKALAADKHRFWQYRYLNMLFRYCEECESLWKQG